jgi:hypothetical protein
MGYRSDGIWIIKGPAALVATALAMAKLEIPELPNTDAGWKDFKAYTDGKYGFIRFSYNSWKWYDSYPDIQWYESIWNWFSNKADTEEFTFLMGKRIRIGEENEDVETRRFGDDFNIELCVNRVFIDDEPATGEPLTASKEN